MVRVAVFAIDFFVPEVLKPMLMQSMCNRSPLMVHGFIGMLASRQWLQNYVVLNFTKDFADGISDPTRPCLFHCQLQQLPINDFEHLPLDIRHLRDSKLMNQFGTSRGVHDQCERGHPADVEEHAVLVLLVHSRIVLVHAHLDGKRQSNRTPETTPAHHEAIGVRNWSFVLMQISQQRSRTEEQSCPDKADDNVDDHEMEVVHERNLSHYLPA
mmetsp:Transcript_61574/g.112573  ORF Transcript_61574/g.112573 Transcript_61574/m.112573 type:complete len:213 (+) Transcript_61574:233-871(+)